MSLYINPNGRKAVDPGPLSAGQVRKLRRAARGSRGTGRGHGPLRATETAEQTEPRGTDTTGDAA